MAPTGGLNTVDGIRSMPVTDCVVLYNMVASELGLRARLGYQEWATAIGAEVRTVLPYSGSMRSQARDALFAVTPSGIFDITAGGVISAANQVVGGASGVPWPTTGGNAGFASYTVLPDANGVHHLLFVDEENGYYTYTEGGPGWQKVYNPGAVAWLANTGYTVGATVTNGGNTYVCVQAGTSAASGGPTGTGTNIVDNTVKWSYAPTITGFDPAQAAHVILWKHRVFLTQRDTARAWFGGLDACFGPFQMLSFAGKFRAGGYLMGLWSWTYDGGVGPDDLLVGVSGGGDVVIYQGTDPSVVGAFSLRGAWSVGAIPNSRRIGTDFGGDLLLATYLGLLPVSKLLLTADQNVSLDRTQYTTYKVSNLFNLLAQQYGAINGWQIKINPPDNTLMVVVPSALGAPATQLVMGLVSKGWSVYRDLPLYSCDVWRGQMFFGTVDGRVCRHTGYIDGVKANGDATTATPVQFSLVSSFQTLGVAKQKRLLQARPSFVAQGISPNFQIQARLDFNMEELPLVSGGLAAASGNTWDAAIWDTSVWQGDYVPARAVVGLSGIGVDVAIALRGQAFARTVFAGADIGFDLGGFL